MPALRRLFTAPQRKGPPLEETGCSGHCDGLSQPAGIAAGARTERFPRGSAPTGAAVTRITSEGRRSRWLSADLQ